MKVLRAFRTELDPSKSQADLFGRCAGASRYVYNWGLAEWERQHKAGEKPSQYGLRKQFNAIKDQTCPWIRDLPYAVTESAFGRLGAAFENFFRRVKNGEKPGYPKFKKRGRNASFQIRGVKIERSRVRITGAGWVKLKERGYIPAEAERYGIYATISERAKRWYISVLVEQEIDDPGNPAGAPLGIDLGIKDLAVCSDGTVFENSKVLNKAEKRLKRLQRELSRRKKGGKNREKTKDQLARAHKKVSDIRSHQLHNISHSVTFHKQPSVIVLENLNVKGMVANHHLARAISDASFGELRRQIEYKAKWMGAEVLIADRFYASSKTCSVCGTVKTELDLSERVYNCDVCGYQGDRDYNAACNLAALANRETHGDCLGS